MIYVIRNGREVKIGVSSDPYKRWNDIQISNKETVVLEYVIAKGGLSSFDWEVIEGKIHRQVKEHRYREGSEWFTLDKELVNWVLTGLQDEFTILTGDMYLTECANNPGKFTNPQLWSQISNFSRMLSEGYYTGDESKILGGYSILEKRGGFISYNDVAMVSGCSLGDVQHVMRNTGTSKILIQHNRDERSSRSNKR